MQKKILFICSLLIFTIFMITGCSSSKPNDSKIMKDLNETSFINVAKLYDNDDSKTIPVTAVSIVDVNKENKNCVITCNVVQENSDYKKESQLVISYNKLDDWYMDTYNVTNVVVTPLSGVPDDVVRSSYEMTSLAGYDDEPVATVDCTGISHNFDEASLTDTTFVECTVTSATCKREVSLTLNYKFDNEWKKKSGESKTVSREWRGDNLAGKIWQRHFGAGGVRTARINSIDTSAQTIDISYGYDTLNHTEVCKYTIYDDGKEQMLKVSLTYDFYNVEIHEDGIWYGMGLKEITE